MRRGILTAALAAGLLIVSGSIRSATSQAPAVDRESAYRANNVGIGYLEQFDYDKAVESFRKALTIDGSLGIARLNLALALFYANDPDGALSEARAAADKMPDSPHAHYLLGLIARSQNRTEDATAEFRRVLDRDPEDVGAKVNLGQVYVQDRNFDAAIKLLREAIASEPFNVTAAYNLATALTRSGAQEEGRAAMAQFQTLRDSTYGTTYAQTYLAQGKYAEAVASTGAESDLVNRAMPSVSFVDATSTMLPVKPRQDPAQPPATSPGSVTLFDADNDGDLDLVEADASGLRLFRNAQGVLSEASGLIPAAIGASIAAVAADYDNDGRPDLFVLRAGGNRLLRQQADGRFEDVTAATRIPAYPNVAKSAAFVDVDHDGDLDLFIVGSRWPASANQAPSQQRRRYVHRHHRRGQSQWRRRSRHRRRPDRLRQSPRHGPRRGRSRRCADALSECPRRIVSRCGGRRAAAGGGRATRPSPRPTSTRTATPTSSSAGRTAPASSR